MRTGSCRRFIYAGAMLFCAVSPMHSLELDYETAVAMALDASIELAGLRQGIADQSRALTASLGQWLPKLTLNFNNYRSVRVNSPDTQNLSLGFSVRQQIYDSGNYSRAREMGEIRVQLMLLELEQAEKALANQVWQQFFSLILLSEKQKILEEQISIQRRQLSIAQRELSLGRLRNQDVLELQTALSRTELDLQQHVYLRGDGLFDFKMLLGIPEESRVTLVGEIDRRYEGQALNISLDEAVRLTESNSVELRKQGLLLFQMQSQIRAAGQWYNPQVALEFTLGMTGNSLPLQNPNLGLKIHINFPSRWVSPQIKGSLSESGENEFSRGISGSLGILEDLSVFWDQGSRRSALERETHSFDQSLLSMRRNIQTMFCEYALARQQLALSRSSLELANREFQMRKLKLSQGRVSVLELIQAQSRYFESQLTFTEEVLALIQAEHGIASVLGLSESDIFSQFQGDAL